MANFSFERSADGRKARPPQWWSRFVSKLPKIYIDALRPKTWTPELAERWIALTPAKCPFERQLWYGNTLLLYIPPLCPLNPLSAQFYQTHLEALTYLYDLKNLQNQFKD